MRIILFVLLFSSVVFAAPWPSAVGYLGEHDCTVWAVRPRLLVTASHCVTVPGDTRDVVFFRGVVAVPHKAVVVYDGLFRDESYVDLALLVPDRDWSSPLPLAVMLPPTGSTLLSSSISLGVEKWQVPVYYRGLYRHGSWGWALVGTGDIGSGGSGSPWSLNGQVVGVHVAGAQSPALQLAIPVGLLRQALRYFDTYGPMSDPYP